MFFKRLNGKSPVKEKCRLEISNGLMDQQVLPRNTKDVCDVIYRTDIKNNKVIFKTALSADKSHNLQLYYGYGMIAYCNITDAKDRSLPVFGPCRIPWGK